MRNSKFCEIEKWISRCLALVTVLCVCTTSLPAAMGQQESPITTVFLVRHAEKGSEAEDPELTDIGRARAQRLAAILARADVSALYASEYRRTQQTLVPVAKELGLTVEVREASRHADLVKEILDRHAGKVVLVASHSNVLPLLIESLGGGSIEEIGEMEYDNLFVVTVTSDGSCRVTKLKY